MGFADARIAKLIDGATEAEVRAARKASGVEAVFNAVDTCGAEFPRVYALPVFDLRKGKTRRKSSNRKKIMILGGGPQSYRPGNRVRLLLRARRVRAERGGLRDHHG
jgi:carbamoyl-phosphate synthase large subunit